MKFTLYTANCTGNEKNIHYPNQKVITAEADLKKAISYDLFVPSIRMTPVAMQISLCLTLFRWTATTTTPTARRNGLPRSF